MNMILRTSPRQNVGPDLGPNCLQRLSADGKAGKVLMQKVKYNGFDLKLSEPWGCEVTNNLHPGCFPRHHVYI